MTPTIACPLCHQTGPVLVDEVLPQVRWKCTRCGQHWDADRLAAVAAYAVWLIDHDRKRL
jgi:transposase